MGSWAAGLALAVFYGLGILGVAAFLQKRHAKEGGGVNWSPFESVSVVVAVYIISQLVVGLLFWVFLSSDGTSLEALNDKLAGSVLAQFLFVLAVDLAMFGAVYKFIVQRKTNLANIGVVRPKYVDVVYALTGFGMYFVGSLSVIFLAQHFFPALDMNQEQDIAFSRDASGLALLPIFVSLVILPPIVEEFTMRGFLYSGLRTKLAFLPSAVAVGVIFAAAHLQIGSGSPLLWTAAIDTLALSFALVWLREKTGSLWPCVMLHMTKNLLAFISLYALNL